MSPSISQRPDRIPVLLRVMDFLVVSLLIGASQLASGFTSTSESVSVRNSRGFTAPSRILSFSSGTPHPAFLAVQNTQSGQALLSSSQKLRLHLSAASSPNDDDDLEAVQSLFSKYCDTDGLMTKKTLMKIDTIADMLATEDLLYDELTDIWNAAPKFPSDNNRMDVDSFIQVFRDIDDLFEDDDEGVDDSTPTVASGDSSELDDGFRTLPDDREEEELKSAFATLCNKDELLDKQTFRAWTEIGKLLEEGLLGQDEFEELWSDATKVVLGGSDELGLDLKGFLSINAALDDLFVFDDDEGEDDSGGEGEGEGEVAYDSTLTDMVVVGEDLPPVALFADLANEDNLVGRKELNRWSELQQMLSDESLLPLELQNIFDDVTKADGTDHMLDEAGFIALWEAIDALFEDVDGDDDEEVPGPPPQSKNTQENEAKSILLSLLDELNSDEERLPCGLESTEREELQVQRIVSALEESPSNVIQQTQGNVGLSDLEGDWDLLYSSSSAMRFNKGLSGLGGSVPNGKFGGLVQKLQASKYLTDVEYIERIDVNPSSGSFDVRVSGVWDLRTSVSLFTGAPSTVLTVEPDQVRYGPTSTKADHWKSLGPLNMLDVTYLDNDLRVMRGNTATDAIFVFRRSSSS